MPLMFAEQPQKQAEVSLGDVTIPANEVTAGTVKERSWETTSATLVLPAGAYSIHVRHVDPTGGEITVNAQAIGFNRIFERAVREDRVAKTQDFTPEVTIQNPLGKTVAISVSYPSSSNVNPQSL